MKIKFAAIWLCSNLVVQSALVGVVFAIGGAFAALLVCRLIVQLHLESAFLGYVLLFLPSLSGIIAGVCGVCAALNKFQSKS
jgi:hypothetical protein